MTELERYIDSIWNIPVLSHSEVRELIRKAQKGCNKSRNKVIKHNLRLVMNVVKRYHYACMDKMDLVSAGNFGLFIAINKFDVKKNFKFSTYAYSWIRQHIQRYIHNNCYTVRLPVHMRDKIRNIQKKKVSGKTLTEYEEHILGVGDITMVSLDKPVGKETSLYDILTVKNPLNSNHKEVEDMKEICKKNMKSFSDREKKIFEYRCQGRTFREIGLECGISHERVRQIMVSITKRLKEKLEVR